MDHVAAVTNDRGSAQILSSWLNRVLCAVLAATAARAEAALHRECPANAKAYWSFNWS